MKKIILSISIVSILLTSCGNDKKEKITKHQPKTEQVKAVKINNKTVEKTNGITLKLASTDQLKYDKTELKVKAGQEVTLILSHTGKMPKTAMGHNFVLLKKGTDIAKFAVEAIGASKNEYIPKSNAIIAYTKLIGGGESTTITFTAPAKGTYDFICSFPGHYSLMKGKFIVE